MDADNTRWHDEHDKVEGLCSVMIPGDALEPCSALKGHDEPMSWRVDDWLWLSFLFFSGGFLLRGTEDVRDNCGVGARIALGGVALDVVLFKGLNAAFQAFERC